MTNDLEDEHVAEDLDDITSKVTGTIGETYIRDLNLTSKSTDLYLPTEHSFQQNTEDERDEDGSVPETARDFPLTVEDNDELIH